MNIALFGTSADPPTIGHRQILQWLAQRFDHVVIWAADNPFKNHSATLEHRVKMLEVLLEESRSTLPNVGVYPDLGHPRTVYTVQKARQHWPSATFTLVIGSDLGSQLPRWYRAQALLKQVNILIMPRPGSPIELSMLQQLATMAQGVSIGDMAGLAVSSSAYRKFHFEQIVTPKIQAYIVQQKLY